MGTGRMVFYPEGRGVEQTHSRLLRLCPANAVGDHYSITPQFRCLNI